MDRRKNVAVSVLLKKKKRLVITLEQKLDLIKRYLRGDFYAKITRDTGIHESTVRHILKHADEIKKKGKALAISGGLQTSARNRSFLMIEMEQHLSEWIEDCNQNGTNVTRAAIQTKARSLFTEVKENGAHTETKETFSASAGWFANFKNRFKISVVKITGGAGSTDKEAASYYTFMKNVMEEDLFEPKKSFYSDSHNVDSTEEAPSRLPEGEPLTLEDSKMELMSRKGVNGDEDGPNKSGFFIPVKKRILESEISSTIPATIDKHLNIATHAKSTSEFDVFGNSVAAQLNNMPLRNAIQLQLDIQQLIAERRLKLIEEGEMNDYI